MTWCMETPFTGKEDSRYVYVTSINCDLDTACGNMTMKCDDIQNRSSIYYQLNNSGVTQCLDCDSCQLSNIEQSISAVHSYALPIAPSISSFVLVNK